MFPFTFITPIRKTFQEDVLSTVFCKRRTGLQYESKENDWWMNFDSLNDALAYLSSKNAENVLIWLSTCEDLLLFSVYMNVN